MIVEFMTLIETLSRRMGKHKRLEDADITVKQRSEIIERDQEEQYIAPILIATRLKTFLEGLRTFYDSLYLSNVDYNDVLINQHNRVYLIFKTIDVIFRASCKRGRFSTP